MDTVSAPEGEVMAPPKPWGALSEGVHAIVKLVGHTTLVCHGASFSVLNDFAMRW
jgi:hypothetical protein